MRSLIERLGEQFPESSRRTLLQWIKWGRICVDGKSLTRATELLSEDQEIALQAKKNLSSLGILPLLYKDRWLLAVNKPANLLSYPADSPDLHALEIVRQELGSSAIDSVHRLDFETSGLLLFARGKEAAKRLNHLFTQQQIEKEYCAIIEGRLAEDAGRWEHYLKEKENLDVEISEAGKGKLAITHFHVVKRSKNFTYLRMRLETGKKHQLRVQSAAIGHPIAGDPRYGATGDPIHRLCLHAYTMRLKHPFLQKELELIAPLPRSFHNLGYTDDLLSR
jgi:23S rRNA pseudouridine1911/1915/1917 synthase